MDKVYVENDWYDGPRNGIADFEGVPHRFVAHFDDLSGYLDTFTLFPICPEELALEIEQWNIFVDWNKKYQSGELTTETHPGYGNYSQRYNEIQSALESKRNLIPQCAFHAKANFKTIDQKNRYEGSGPNYYVVWYLIK